MGGIHEGQSMIPDNSKKKLEQLRQEMALRAQLQQQYDKEMSGRYNRDMIPFTQWMDQRQQPKKMAKGGLTDDDYRSEHTAPSPDFGAPMHDVTRDMYPKDFYSPSGFRIYADHGEHKDRDAYNKVVRVKNKPNEMVSIHRAIPTKVYNEALKKDAPLKHMIRKGDWVAINKDYAKDHGESVLLGDYKIASMRVPAKHVWTNADSIHEWGYHPDEKATGGIIRKAEGGKVEPTQDEMRLALSKTNSSKKAQGGTVNAFDYENPKHVTTVAGIASKHRDFNKIPDVAKHLAGALSQGSYKFIEDPRIQSAIKQAGHSGYFINGKDGKQQIVQKAMGGSVLPMEQMKAQMMNRFKGLSTLQSIGADEAPSLGVKAYVPTVGRPDNGQMPVGGVDTQQGDLPVGGIDMNNMQQGQQLMPNAPPSPAGAQQGMDQVPQGDKIPTMDGTGMPPNPNANPNQMGSNILSMTPQGQAMAAMKPQGLARGGQPKVEVRPTVKDDKATRRTPEIETAVKALQAGIINQKEYDRIVQKYKPVKPYEFVPAPATDEAAMNVLIDRQKKSWRSHENWPEGHPVGLRLDIPAYERQGVWVNSIHDESGRGKENFPTSYGPVSAVRNATFEGSPHKAVRVATGEQTKTPFAKIMGELEHIDEKKALAHMKKFLNHPEYRQIGYDPRRHGDFYDRETMEPVESAEHVVQIGPLVLAKKPVYAKKRTQYAEGGSLHYEPAKPLSKQEIEAHADRIARQIAGEDNPNKKSKQQMDREKTLQVDIKSGGKEVATPVINHEDIKGSSMVGVPGDPSRGGVVPRKRNPTRLGVSMPKAGEYLRGVGGQKLEGDVPMLGGYKYGAYGHPNAWASDLGASAGLYNVVKKLYEENPEADIYGQYHKMTPASLNHAVHTLDAVLSHHQPHNAPPEVIENLNHLMRNVKTTTSKHDVPYPSFPGFENPNDVMLHGIMNSGMRKKMIGLLSKDKYLSGGKQKMDDLIFALTHPELRNIETGAGGSAIMQFDPTKDLRQSTSPHTTYGYDLPTKLKGKTRYITPFQLLAPRSNANAIKEIKAMGKEKTVVPFNQAKMNIIREPIDEQYINQLGEYELAMKKRLGYKAGGKVKLHTDQDTMQLALTKKSKKAK